MEGGPDTAAIRRDLKAAGLDPSGFPDPTPITYWPDNESALRAFLAMRTQWTAGPSGLLGLRYEALPEIWQRLDMRKRRERDEAFHGLQVMEAEALEWIREQRHD